MSSDLVPGLTTVMTYQPRWIPKDLVAGLILTTLLVGEPSSLLPMIAGTGRKRASVHVIRRFR